MDTDTKVIVVIIAVLVFAALGAAASIGWERDKMLSRESLNCMDINKHRSAAEVELLCRRK